MSTQDHLLFPPLLHRLAETFRVLRDCGVLLDGPAHPQARPAPGDRPGLAPMPGNQEQRLTVFVAKLRQLLGAADEPTRRHLEQEVLDLAVRLRATGLFEVMRIAHAPLAAMVADHLEADGAPCA
jgi:hypothetical protein